MGLHGLEHKRNRLAGKIEQIRSENRRYLLKIDRMHKQYAINEEKVLKLQGDIDVLSNAAKTAFDTPLDVPVARRTVPKKHLAAWGQISREVSKQLRLADNKPLNMIEITRSVRDSLSLSLSDSEYRHLRKTVSNALWRMYFRGTAWLGQLTS